MKLDICHCMVQTDQYSVIARGETNPITYTEVEVLYFVLGERAITDLKVVDTIDKPNAEILEDIRLKFGKGTIDKCFPGARPRLPTEAPEDVPREGARTEPKKRAPRRKQAAPKPDPVADDLGDAVLGTAAE